MWSWLTHAGPLHPPIYPVTHCSFAGLAGPGSAMVSRPQYPQPAVCRHDSNTAASKLSCRHGPWPLPSHLPCWASQGKCLSVTVSCTEDIEDQASACQRASRLAAEHPDWQNSADMLARRRPGVLYHSLASSTCWLCHCHRSENSCTQQNLSSWAALANGTQPPSRVIQCSATS